MLSREIGPKYGVQQAHLIISAAPPTKQAVVGLRLIDAGALNVAGDYECEIATDHMAAIDVELKPSAVTGTFAPSLKAMRTSRLSNRTGSGNVAAGSNFVAGTTQVLTLSALAGRTVCKVTFTVPSSGSVTFAVGTDLTAPTGIAEWNGA